MFKFNPKINKGIGNVLSPLVEYLHERLGISPNMITVASFVAGVTSAPLIIFHRLELGLFFIFISAVLDGLDGPIARKYGYNLEFGEKLDTVVDRSLELIIFLSLVMAGYINLKIVLLSLVVIWLMTLLRGKTGFDPGFKRIMLFFGYFSSFDLAFQIIFWANLIGFIINLLILDLKEK